MHLTLRHILLLSAHFLPVEMQVHLTTHQYDSYDAPDHITLLTAVMLELVCHPQLVWNSSEWLLIN